MRTPNNYRQNLEAEKEQLLSMLPYANQNERAQCVKRVREIITILAELDSGDNLSQEPGDTKAKIVLSEIQHSSKVIKI